MAIPEEENDEGTNLSTLIHERGWDNEDLYISELVHDALAIEHYPIFTAWHREYGEGRSTLETYPLFQCMCESRNTLKRRTGKDYERFIYSHRDL